MTKLEIAAKEFAEAERWAEKCEAEEDAADRRLTEARKLCRDAHDKRSQAVGRLYDAAIEASK
jgi:hypothetical protein